MKKYKLMHILSDTNFGGAGQYLLHVCQYIDRNIFDVVVILPYNSQLKQHLENVTLIEVDGIADQSFSIKGYYALKKVISKYQPQIIHCHGSLSGRLAAQRLGTPKIIYTKHTLSQNNHLWIKEIKRLLNRFLRAEVIAISQAIKDNLLEEGLLEKKIHLIYSGVPLINKEKLVFSKPGKTPIVVGFVGRLEHIKGPHHFLRVVQQVMENKDESIVFKMAGEGSMKEALLESIREKQLEVVMVGFVEDINSFYQSCHIIVNTSESEALSFSTLEAFSNGKPVIAFDIPGINEVISHQVDGFLIPSLEYETFADAIIKLAKDCALRDLFGVRGKQKVEEKYTVEQMVQQTQNVYIGGLYE